MDAKEALRILHPDTTVEALNEIECYGIFNGLEAIRKACNDACEVAFEALKKQIPMKPDKEQGVERCPVCFTFFIDDYCARCGQKIDWSEDE